MRGASPTRDQASFLAAQNARMRQLEQVAHSHPGGAMSSCEDCDDRFVNADGDTMTGALVMSGGSIDMGGGTISNLPNPTGPTQPVTAQYADNRYVNAAGDTMTGNLTLSMASLISTTGQVRLGADPSAAGQATSGVWIYPGGRLNSSQDISQTPNLFLRRVGAANAAGEPFIRFIRGVNNVIEGSVAAAAGGGVAYNTTSDGRLKKRLGDCTDAAERIASLGAKAYRGSRLDDPNGGERDMLNAEAIAQIAPYAVTGEPDQVDEDGEMVPMLVDYSALVPLLTAALADQQNQINALTARINALEAR